MHKARFEGFSEGVFAFAFTLLVLGFVVPHAERISDPQLARSLLSQWPNLISYALSVAVIGIMWHNHQALFRMVARIDRVTVFWNLLLLGGTAFIPFATNALGSYPSYRASTFLYGLVLTYCATAYNLMLNHLVAARLFQPEIGSQAIAQTVRAYRTGWVGYAVSMLLALWSPLLAFAAYLGVALYYLVPHGLDTDSVAGGPQPP